MNDDTRRRMLDAADRALRTRREKIMVARLTIVAVSRFFGHGCNWHSLFECDRHGHHPLRAEWVGPYDVDDTVDTSGRVRSSV